MRQKIAKVRRNFIAPKNTQITYRKNSKNNNVYSKQIRLTKKGQEVTGETINHDANKAPDPRLD